MSSRLIWGAGLGAGFAWTTAIAGTDMAGLAANSTVLSSVATITNQTSLDIYAHISVRLTVASATPPNGANVAIYLAALLDDGTTFGNGSLSSGTTVSRALPYPPNGIVSFDSGAATTLLAGFIQGILLPPGSFRFALYNGSGAALSATAANNVVMYRTYVFNLNG